MGPADNMPLMDAEAWTALGQWASVVVALAVAAEAWRRAGRAGRDAEHSLDVARASRDAQIRMADALDRLSPTGVERRAGGDQDRESTRDEVTFLIEPRGKNSMALRNYGPSKATNVTIEGLQDGLTRDLPQGIDLDPMQSHSFLVLRVWGVDVPGEVRVRSDQVPEGVLVPMPQGI